MWNIILKPNTSVKWLNFVHPHFLKKLNIYVSNIKINRIITSYSLLKYHEFLKIKLNLMNLPSIYFEFFKILKLNYYLCNWSIIFKLKKKQLYSYIIENSKIKYQNTNGSILKQLNIAKKSSKKETKICLINIKTICDHKFIKPLTHVVCIVNGLRFLSSKIIGAIRKNIFKKKVYLIIKPLTAFNLTKFKKIKSIKRKLRKRYSYLNN